MTLKSAPYCHCRSIINCSCCAVDHKFHVRVMRLANTNMCQFLKVGHSTLSCSVKASAHFKVEFVVCVCMTRFFPSFFQSVSWFSMQAGSVGLPAENCPVLSPAQHLQQSESWGSEFGWRTHRVWGKSNQWWYLSSPMFCTFESLEWSI